MWVMKNEYEIFIEQFEGKRTTAKPGRRRKINLKDIGSRMWPNKVCRWNVVDAIMKIHVLQQERNLLDS
jgi:hypothetical protein